MKVLGSMMRSADAVREAIGILRSDDFYKPEYRTIFSAISNLDVHDEPVDLVTVADELERNGKLDSCGGRTGLLDIADSVFTAVNTQTHARIVAERATLRRLTDFAKKLVKKSSDNPGDIPDLISQTQVNLEKIIDDSRRNGNKSGTGVLVWLDQVVEEEIEWIWRPWLPAGKLVMVNGEPKAGKTTMALQVVSNVSKGYGFPLADHGKFTERHEPANSIIMCGEDGLADTLKKRLRQARADHSRIVALTGKKVQGGFNREEQAITLEDMPIIEDTVHRVQPSIVVIDPIQAYIGSNVDFYRANETRPIMTELATMAQKYKFCCLVLGHLRKSEGSAMHRSLGGIDFGAIARSLVLIAKDPTGTKHDRVMAHTACNLATEADSLKFSISDEGEFRWGGPDERTADELCRSQSRHTGSDKPNIADAEEWLTDTLRHKGATSGNEVLSLAARQGISNYAIRQASYRVGVKKKRIGSVNVWYIEKEDDDA